MVSPVRGGSSSSPSADITVQSVRWGTAESAVKVGLTDGSSFFVLISRFDSARFAEGSLLTEAEYELLVEYDEEVRAHRKALELLSRREHSEFELKRKLLQRRFESHLIDQVCTAMKNEGYLDDRRFAGLFLSARLRRKAEGRIRLEQRLREKGVSREIAREVLDEVCTPELFAAALQHAVDLIRRRRGDVDDAVLRRELQKRGFLNAEISDFFDSA